MTVALGLAALNGALALALGSIYYRNHRDIGSPFTLGLLLFAGFLVVHDAIQVYHLATMMATFTGLSAWFLVAESGLQTLALGTLLRVTLR